MHVLAVKIEKSYLLALSQLASHYNKSPGLINEDEMRGNFQFLKNKKPASRCICTINLCGIKFFFQHILGREWNTYELARPEKRNSRSSSEWLKYAES